MKITSTKYHDDKANKYDEDCQKSGTYASYLRDNLTIPLGLGNTKTALEVKILSKQQWYGSFF